MKLQKIVICVSIMFSASLMYGQHEKIAVVKSTPQEVVSQSHAELNKHPRIVNRYDENGLLILPPNMVIRTEEFEKMKLESKNIKKP